MAVCLKRKQIIYCRLEPHLTSNIAELLADQPPHLLPARQDPVPAAEPQQPGLTAARDIPPPLHDQPAESLPS